MIPIYRARKIDSDEYIEGILLPNLKRFGNRSFIINDYTRMQDFDNAVQIDQPTLAIHFPNMIDKNGKKIFASLSEACVGGDRVIIPSGYGGDNFYEAESGIVVHYGDECTINGTANLSYWTFNDLEVVEIYKG